MASPPNFRISPETLSGPKSDFNKSRATAPTLLCHNKILIWKIVSFLPDSSTIVNLKAVAFQQELSGNVSHLSGICI
jgi:hypothetical protein